MDGEGNRVSIKSGDHVIVPPGEAHQIINESSVDLIFYALAITIADDNLPTDKQEVYQT